ncbi:PDZ and LIM domain 3 isoform X3 [Brachionus plicatilis]|uniref:PDZ and LIM domain 3 isoform X3 n=1 Tax=Brachionus plicatilis TaxID=10195 RepID=A0A3M7SBL1_BRAPC|nr:PDZ and LIM domain 3 isoform X3 [Brachionus plicatilis]
MASYWSPNRVKNRESCCLKTFYLDGKSPWGFRIVLDSNSQLVISKVRPKSKADLAGLKENDAILLINDLCTQKLALSQASELIESAHSLCLFVLTDSSHQALNMKIILLWNVMAFQTPNARINLFPFNLIFLLIIVGSHQDIKINTIYYFKILLEFYSHDIHLEKKLKKFIYVLDLIVRSFLNEKEKSMTLFYFFL